MLTVRHGKVWINSLGSSRLSKAGSGDVLSGLIVSLLAQGENALDAAIQGSLALVLGAEQYSGSSYAMLPTDLIEEIGKLESCAD
jgi:NAD(P)H-hydrate repair Nnr-like enzyme with NAD(P)H-hydrate dehydratase domain